MTDIFQKDQREGFRKKKEDIVAWKTRNIFKTKKKLDLQIFLYKKMK